MVRLGCFVLFGTLFGQIYAGNFVGKVKVKYDVFTVFEGDSFSMTCIAEHEDIRPRLQWYFRSYDYSRTNLTGFSSSGTGKVATRKYSRSRAKLSDSGDYYCLAIVNDGFHKEERKTAPAVPIQVIEKKNKPRVKITKSRDGHKTVLKCKVYPQGIGYLTWRQDGRRVKYDKLANELELTVTSGGEYQCHGNLTLGGYKHFISTATTSAAKSWYRTSLHTTLLSIILFSFVAFLTS